MVDLSRFGTMLCRCESVKGNVLTDWESRFVVDMREKFNGREDQEDLGMTAWLPSRNQFNTLHEIWSKL